MELSGFQICPSNFFFGATADGIVNCDCCGRGTLEMKCSYKHRQSTLHEAALADKTFCLDQDLKLKTSHRYYTQIQFQMLVFDTSYTDLVVMTYPNSEMCIGIMMMSSSLTTHQPMRVICVKMVN